MDPKIAKLLEKGLIWVEGASDFVAEQAPLVVQEILNWHIASGLGLSVLFFTLFLTFCYGSRLFYIKSMEKNDETCEGLSAMSAVISTIFLVFALINLHSGAKGLIAPRVVVIEELTKMLQTKRDCP